MTSLEKLKFKLEQVNAEIQATIGTVGGGIRLQQLRKQRDALGAEIEDEEYTESERGEPDMDGCEEYAHRFAAV